MTREPRPGAAQASSEDEAFRWLNHLLSGAASSQDLERFGRWRGDDPRHAAAFAEALRLREAVRASVRSDVGDPAGGLASDRVAAPRRPATRRTKGGPRAPNRRKVIGGAVAAGGAGLAILDAREWWQPILASWTSDYHTAHGERRRMSPLPGVSLELNTNTSVAQGESGRPGLRLLSGEFAMKVAPRTIPVTVETLGVRLAISDGDADIRALRDACRVVCVSGEVHVVHPDGRTRVSAGRQLSFTARTLGPVTPVDVTVATAWRRGLLIFRDAPLQAVVDELNRYRSGRILLTDARLARRPVYGVFQLDELDHAVTQVERLTGARATSLAGGWVILS